jgi:protein gp37
MGKHTNIEWCDHTFNPWEGCTKISPGCEHCYAEARNRRFAAGANWGPGAPRRRTSATNWRQPLVWDKEAAREHHAYREAAQDGMVDELNLVEPRRPRVFCASLADWLDDEVPVAWLADLMRLVWATPNLDWLLLTKRPENFERRLNQAYLSQPGATGHSLRMAWWTSSQAKAPSNVWVGTTVENQQRADERIPHLLKIPARVRFLSCEPLLGPVDVRAPAFNGADSFNSIAGIHWVICGGESGPKARPMHPDWARSLRDQCAAAGVPFFFKQWGEWVPIENFEAQTCAGQYGETSLSIDGRKPAKISGEFVRVWKSSAGRLLDGAEYNAFPTSLNPGTERPTRACAAIVGQRAAGCTQSDSRSRRLPTGWAWSGRRSRTT